MSKTLTVEAGEKVLDVLRVLERNFIHGYSPTELAKATGFPASAITRYVATLEAKGYAERIPETGRIRISHRLAQVSIQIMNSLDAAAARIEESRQRITRMTGGISSFEQAKQRVMTQLGD
ncbi:helix-turn-helix domain-containing protein [Methylocaldum sp.]|uniref:helix-turn-helix domain-containing protein n=1 Tax=Methylocaldum sp. TaxID=1969727 RepID=UPI002D51B35F|nr:helix-turn-helix domain-containing protein [Methylocaldum sp.]HYE35490.1 helix-turn-helix domain-containing protein [Methylocaldum sp.]